MFNNDFKAKAQYEANKDNNWSWDDWQENAPERLEYMEGINPNQFSNLYQAEFKVIPNMGTLIVKETESVIPQVIQSINNVSLQTVNSNHNAIVETLGTDINVVGQWFTCGDPTPYRTEAEAAASGYRMNEQRNKLRVGNSN